MSQDETRVDIEGGDATGGSVATEERVTPWDAFEPGWYLLGCRPIENKDGAIEIPLPHMRFTYGGQSFPYECADENPRKSSEGNWEYNQMRHGQRVYLDAEALKVLSGAYGTMVYSRSTTRVSLRTSMGFRPRSDDIPVERFLYCVACEEPAPGPLRRAMASAEKRRAELAAQDSEQERPELPPSLE